MWRLPSCLLAAACLTLPASASVVLFTQANNGLTTPVTNLGASSVTGVPFNGGTGTFDALADAIFGNGTVTLMSSTSVSISQYPARTFQGAEGATVFSAAASKPAIREAITVYGGSGDGTLIYSFLVQGSASASDSAGGQVAYVDSWINIWNGNAQGAAFLNPSDEPYLVNVDVPFTFGTPFSLYLALETSGNLYDYNAAGPYDAEMHTAFTAEWFNTAIADAQGGPVPGAWWSAEGPMPVESAPEPATLALVFGGVVAGIGLRKFRHVTAVAPRPAASERLDS